MDFQKILKLFSDFRKIQGQPAKNRGLILVPKGDPLASQG